MKYRSIAHVIGYFDMVVTLLEIVLAVGMCLAYIFGWISIEGDEKDKMMSSSQNFNDRLFSQILTVVMIAEIVGVFIIGAIQIYGAYKLIKGTEKGVSPYDGLSFCRTWRNITLVLFALLIPYMINDAVNGNLQKDFLPILTFIILRIIALICVRQYMTQLETTLPTVMEMDTSHSSVSDACRLINK